MKKIILIFICCFMINTIAVAATVTGKRCNESGGVIISTNDDFSYCIADRDMNWWSARLWCREMGTDLVDIQQDCNCPDVNCSVCQRLSPFSGAGRLWTKNSREKGTAMVINTAYSQLPFLSFDKKDTAKPICPMK